MTGGCMPYPPCSRPAPCAAANSRCSRSPTASACARGRSGTPALSGPATIRRSGTGTGPARCRADGEPLGLIGLADIDPAGGSAEILYWCCAREGLPGRGVRRGRGAWGQATARTSRWAPDELGLHRLRITHSVANPASCRVAATAGFAWEGTLRSALFPADGWHDEHLHGRVQGDP
ncbi:GNAT family N-acetyltransferase [Streptomyces sp. cmx-4-9]|uniref:GNAT family N-acetyltransferase n=1 Tax=Streptomyces sp. cmx-4-9 TaxID=2790941 RepID=UPI003981038F